VGRLTIEVLLKRNSSAPVDEDVEAMISWARQQLAAFSEAIKSLVAKSKVNPKTRLLTPAAGSWLKRRDVRLRLRNKLAETITLLGTAVEDYCAI
jgi:hypothetical protein